MKGSTKLLALGALGILGVVALSRIARAKVIPPEAPLVCTEGEEKRKLCLIPGSPNYNQYIIVERCLEGQWKPTGEPVPVSWCWAPPVEKPELYTTCTRIQYPSGAERDVCQTGTLGQIKCKYTTDPLVSGVSLRTCFRIGG